MKRKKNNNQPTTNNRKTTKKGNNMKPLKQIGFAGVDSGLLMIGDPCYFIGPRAAAQKRFKDWRGFLSEHMKYTKSSQINTQMTYELGHDGLGVAFETTHGDGFYPVYVQKNEHGRPRFAIVVMDGSDVEEIIK